MNFTFMILVIFFFMSFLDSKKISYLFFAVCFYSASLFLRESIILLPIWLVPASFFYCRYKSLVINWIRLLGAISVFCVLNGLYFLLRLYLYPIHLGAQGEKMTLNPVKLFIGFKDRFFDLVTMIVDIVNLAWLSGGNRLLKGFLILAIGMLLSWLFYRNAHKKLVIFLLLSLIPFMWPAILRYYSSRYLYKGLPLIIAALIVLIKFYKTKNYPRYERISLVSMWVLLCVNGFLLCNHLRMREGILHKNKLAFIELAANQACQGRPLCFVGLPYEMFPSGVAQAMWLYGIDPKTPIYYDTSTFLWYKKVPTHNPLHVSIDGSVMTIEVLDKQNSWLNPFNQFCKMGVVTSTKIDRTTGMTQELRYELDDKYAKQDMLVITWDYKNWSFKIL